MTALKYTRRSIKRVDGGRVLRRHFSLPQHKLKRLYESATDFAYALALARRNFSDQQIKDRIINERQNWQNHQGKKRMNDYIWRTIAKTRDILSNSTK
jgi:hypothetical protein